MKTNLSITSSWRRTFCNPERYIHKYYLPRELKRRIRPKDIRGLCFLLHRERLADPFEGRIPEELPEVVIRYTDLELERVVSGAEVRQVLLAHWRYRQDRQAVLTAEERRAAINLNGFLAGWEKTLQAEQIRLTEEMEQRLNATDSSLADYEIDLEISFYLRDDDPFCRGNSLYDDSEDDLDSASSLICTTHYLLDGPLTAREAADPEYSGLGDNQAHNEPVGDEELGKVRHCALFHALYGHLHVPLKHMGRIGRVWADFKVWHQTGFDLDLRGERPVACPLSKTDSY